MSQKDFETFRIKDTNYQVFMLHPDTADDVALLLIQTLAPIAGAFKGAVKDGKLDLDSGIDLSEVLPQCLKAISKEDLKFITQTMYGCTKVDMGGTEGFMDLSKVYSIHFKGKFKSKMTFLVKALKVNFGELFEGGLSDIGL